METKELATNNSFFRLLTYIGEAPTAFMPSRHDRQAAFANLLAVIDPGHDGTDWVAVANTGAGTTCRHSPAWSTHSWLEATGCSPLSDSTS